ncbi:MAG: thiamine diphosphokinase [Bacillota bacterium]|nr:thiamine diphosphokinase [Bacillota bacterium]
MNSTTGRRCVIVGGAPIDNYEGICKYLREDDFYIFCDCGLKHLDHLHIGQDPLFHVAPDLIVGDFDSYENPLDSSDSDFDVAEIETIVLPCEKDETDTAFAASEALRRGFRDFLIIGAVGKRMDHTLVNVSLLLKLYNAGCSASLVDDYSEMEIIGKEPSYIEDSFKYFSLFSMFGPSRGITITGAKYEVTDAEIRQDEQYATSNEVLPGRRACVTAGDGLLLLIKIRHE